MSKTACPDASTKTSVYIKFRFERLLQKKSMQLPASIQLKTSQMQKWIHLRTSRSSAGLIVHCLQVQSEIYSLCWRFLTCLLVFFFLWSGRSRSKARSLHEKKLLVRKLLHGRRWSHAAWQIITTKTQTQKNKARRRSPSQICVSPSERQQSKQRTGQEPNKKNHKRFAKDTVVKTHCVAINSKPCSKWISSHPETWDMRTTLLPGRQQKSRLLYTVD